MRRNDGTTFEPRSLAPVSSAPIPGLNPPRKDARRAVSLAARTAEIHARVSSDWTCVTDHDQVEHRVSDHRVDLRGLFSNPDLFVDLPRSTDDQPTRAWRDSADLLRNS